ncbi:MAG: DUF5684 domain-containing protein [Desulfuromonadales bacterium]|nr:DUF5684 domain-containing protein [Desulfuromonadales bacterium]
MRKIWRLLLLALLLNATLATVVLARPVYLADGGIIEAQKVWQEDGRVYVLLNRDSLIFFPPQEINLQKTFAQKKQVAKTKAVAKSVEVPATTAPAPAAGAVAVAVAEKPATAAGTAVKSAPAPAVPAPAVKTAPPRPVVAPPAEEKFPEMLAFAFLGAGLLFILLIIASFWKVFEKAGEAGWKSLIPIYNLFVLLRIAGCPSWWLLMFFLPVVNIYFLVVMHIRLAEKFDRSPLFGFALCFLGFIFFPILAFGSATYEGDEADFTFAEEDSWEEERP